MTDPMAENFSAGAQEIVAQAGDLGLTWTLRPATVADDNPLSIIYDGDTTITNPINLTGHILALGRRVMGLLIPPSGNFVVGLYGEDPGYSVVFIDSVSSVTPGSPVGAEAVVLTFPNSVYRSERAYKFEFQGDVISSNATNFVLWRLRRNGIAGTIMAQGVWTPRSSAGGSNDFGTSVIIRNNTALNITEAMVLTFNVGGAGTITLNGGPTQVAWLRRYDTGPADIFPNAPSL